MRDTEGADAHVRAVKKILPRSASTSGPWVRCVSVYGSNSPASGRGPVSVSRVLARGTSSACSRHGSLASPPCLSRFPRCCVSRRRDSPVRGQCRGTERGRGLVLEEDRLKIRLDETAPRLDPNLLLFLPSPSLLILLFSSFSRSVSAPRGPQCSDRDFRVPPDMESGFWRLALCWICVLGAARANGE